MSVVTLAQAKSHLNITVATFDSELQSMLDSCEAALVKKVGPLASTATTVDVEGGRCLLLPTTPVVSLTSVTPINGTALTVSDLHVTTSGVITWTLGGCFTSTWYTVVYQAGRATLPDDLKLAVLELVRHKWTTQRGSGRPGSVEPIPGAAYMFPYVVNELIADHIQIGV